MQAGGEMLGINGHDDATKDAFSRLFLFQHFLVSNGTVKDFIDPKFAYVSQKII